MMFELDPSPCSALRHTEIKGRGIRVEKVTVTVNGREIIDDECQSENISEGLCDAKRN